MAIVYPNFSVLAQWAQNTLTQTHITRDAFGNIISQETTYTTDRYDPATDTTEIPLGATIGFGSTLIVIARFKNSYGHISRPFFTRTHEYIEDLPGVDVLGNPELQEWSYDEDPPGVSPATWPVECWSFRPTADLPPETLIRVRGCTAVHLIHVDQICHRQGFPVLAASFDPAAPHSHYNSAAYPPDLHFFSEDREMQVLPVAAIGAFAFQIGGGGMSSAFEQQVPEEQFVLDAENTAWPKIEGDQISEITSSTGGGPPSAPSQSRIRHRMYPGYRILEQPAEALGDREHLSGVFTETQPSTTYTSYLNYGLGGTVQYYTIQIRETGRWLFNLATYQGWYFRTDTVLGNVWVRRARRTEPPFDSQVQVTSSGMDSRPVLYLDGERLYLLFGRSSTPVGVYRCYSDDDSVTWSTPTLEIPNGRYPFPVVEPCSGNIIEAAYVDGVLKGRLITAGGEVGDLKTFKDETGADIPVEEGTFGLAWQDDAQAGLILVVHVLGEEDVSEWLCTDGGEYFTFQRVAA